MPSKIRYSAIVGSLGQTSDRFMRCGYKDPELDKVEFPDVIASLEELGVLAGVDLYQAPDGPYSDADTVNEILEKHHLTASSVLPQVFGDRKWKYGSLTAADPQTRKEALELCKRNIDFNSKLIGTPSVNLWLGQDGFDYPLQTDYSAQWGWIVEAVRELADYNPDVKLTLEGKIREPRNRCLIDTTMTALLVCEEVGRPNVGVAIDTGHVFMAQQNVAQNIEVAARHGRLFMMHSNDNYNTWDDDMITGSLRLTEFIEMFYALRKFDYDGFISVDIFPYREDSYEATRQSVLNMKKYDETIDKIGFDRLTELIQEGNPNRMTQAVREAVFGK
ncbi:MAG: sugar phosphate isomerase/epimerase [Eubacterium sp.]|nr:sugar phosphate isomerase/epimerase [Eubacterium sp.]